MRTLVPYDSTRTTIYYLILAARRTYRSTRCSSGLVGPVVEQSRTYGILASIKEPCRVIDKTAFIVAAA